MLSKSRIRDNNNWAKRHKLQKKIYRYRSASRRFLKSYANLNDLLESKRLINQREKMIKNK